MHPRVHMSVVMQKHKKDATVRGWTKEDVNDNDGKWFCWNRRLSHCAHHLRASICVEKKKKVYVPSALCG